MHILRKGNDMLSLQIALHISGQVKILKSKFIDVGVTGRRIYDHSKALIQRHSHLMAMTKMLANAISFILLMQLFVSSILLCIMGEYYITCVNFAKQVSDDYVVTIYAKYYI